jgi:hypothetical protein
MEPTLYQCCAVGCRTRGHDITVAHVHDYDDATREYMAAEAAATAKRAMPVTLVNCMNPSCRTPPHTQDIAHVHSFGNQTTTFTTKGN